MTLRPFSSTLQGNYRDVFQTPGSPEVIDDDVPVLGIVNIRDNYSSAGAQWTEEQNKTMLLASGTASASTATLLTASGNGQYISCITVGLLFSAGGGTATIQIGGSTVFFTSFATADHQTVVIPFPAGREPLITGAQTVTAQSSAATIEVRAAITYFAR